MRFIYKYIQLTCKALRWKLKHRDATVQARGAVNSWNETSVEMKQVSRSHDVKKKNGAYYWVSVIDLYL